MTLHVAVIGSFRQHYDKIIDAVKEFESFNVTVTTPSVSRIVNPGESYARFETDSPHLPDRLIQAATLERILKADLVYVVAPSGYVGHATWYELGHVHCHGMPVYYSEVPQGVPIIVPQEAVVSVPALLNRILRQGGSS